MTQWADYIAAGWKLTAIAPGSKGPKTKGWNVPGAPFNGVALGAGLCHAYSGTCTLDVDNYDRAEKWLADNGIRLADMLADTASVQISSGREGRAKLVYRLTTPLPSLHLCPYTVDGKTFHALELRCATKDGLTVQDVLPPTIHPGTGNPYQWVYGDPVLGHWSNLPPLPAALEALWRAQVTPATEIPPTTVETKGAALDEIRELLKHQDPGADYEAWLKVGLALHHETKGSAVGFALWDGWSQGSKDKYKGSLDLRGHWDSFHADAENPVTLGSLRRETVAAPSDFPIMESSAPGTSGEFGEPDVGEDTRPVALMQRLLEPRLVYLLNQGKYYFLPVEGSGAIKLLDEHGECGLGVDQMHMLFNPHMPVMTYNDAKGNVKRKEVTPRQYLEKSQTKTVVGALGFHPGEGRIYREDRVKYLNRYIAEPVEALKPTNFEREAWEFLTGRIQDDLFRRWLMKFYAYALKYPGVKIEAAPLLFSRIAGNGKTTLMSTVPKLLYGDRYVKEVSSDTVGSRFTSVLSDAWWIVLDELKTDGPKMDRVHVANKIKPWITSRTISIEKKGLDVYEIRNRIQITASSNFDDSIHVENDDRRWGISEMGGEMMTQAEKTCLFGGFLNTERAPGVLKWIFEQESLTGFNPKAEPPNTAGKRTVAAANLGHWETKLAEAIYAGKAPFDRDVLKIQDVQDFLAGCNASQLKLGAILPRPPFSMVKQRDASGNVWIWRNVAEWRRQTGAARAAHAETGARPEGNWDFDIPIAIRRAVGDDTEPFGEFDDLLGVSNG